MASTLGEYLAFKNNIDNMGVRVKATAETDLEYSVYLSEEGDVFNEGFKVYGSTIHMQESEDYKWITLPINLYTDSAKLIVKLVKNPNIIVAEETWNNVALAAG